MANVLAPTEEDISMLLATQAHLGTKNLDPAMERYTHKRRPDGIYIINLHKTWEKLVLAARAIVAIENPKDVVAVSGRAWGQRAVLKFAKYTGSTALAGRYTPGTFTNQIQAKYIEPRLLIVTDPHTDHQAVIEGSYGNVVTIAFCHSDSPVNYVDIAIPCNNKGKQSTALMWWLLTREVLRLRKQIDRKQPWDVMVDMFIYRDPDEQEKDEQNTADQVEATAAAAEEGEGGDWGAPEETFTQGDWNATHTTSEWGQEAATPAGGDWDSSVATPSGWDAASGN